jgi:hypothetical protein
LKKTPVYHRLQEVEWAQSIHTLAAKKVAEQGRILHRTGHSATVTTGFLLQTDLEKYQEESQNLERV